MATQRTDFRTRIKYRASNRSDLTNAQLDQWLNAGFLDMQMRIRLRQSEAIDTSKTFTVGVNTVTFPTNMIAVLHVRNTTDDRPMEYIDWTEYRRLRIVSGDPTLWTTWGTTIYLDKLATTTDALSIFGISQIAWAAGDSATPGVDDQLEYGIELLAAAHMFRDLGQPEKAALIENPMSPGVGEFWVWVRANRHPRLIQGLASRTHAGFHPVLTGYDGLGGSL